MTSAWKAYEDLRARLDDDEAFAALERLWDAICDERLETERAAERDAERMADERVAELGIEERIGAAVHEALRACGVGPDYPWRTLSTAEQKERLALVSEYLP